MSDTLQHLQEVKWQHQLYTRCLTLLLSTVVCSVGFILWINEIPLLDSYKPITGLIIIGLAVIFFKIPYFAYQLNWRHFMHNEEKVRLMGQSWQEYKQRFIN